jgi:hypothetical protein
MFNFLGRTRFEPGQPMASPGLLLVHRYIKESGAYFFADAKLKETSMKNGF